MKKSNISFLGSFLSFSVSLLLLVVIGYFLIEMNRPEQTKPTNTTEQTNDNPEKEKPADIDEQTYDNPGQYVGRTGYAIISPSLETELYMHHDFTDTSLWVIPTFVPDKQFYEKTDVTIPHKTPVTVLEQDVKHTGYGVYSGYLLVENTDDGSQYWIETINFEEEPYWTYTGKDLRDAAMMGTYLAEFNQVSDYYPVHPTSGGKATVEDGSLVLVTGPSGTIKNLHDIDESEWVIGEVWLNKYAPISLCFNVNDLTVIY